MLAAVVRDASTLKAARIIVEFRTDLLSANTRLDIRIFVAFAVASALVASVAAFVARAAALVVSLRVPFSKSAALPKKTLAFAAMVGVVLPKYPPLYVVEIPEIVDGRKPWRSRIDVVKS